MSEKLFLLILFLGWDFYFLLIAFLSLLSDRRPVPEQVRDITSSDDFSRKKTGHELSMRFLIKCMLAFSAACVFLLVVKMPESWYALISGSAVIEGLAGVLLMVLVLLFFGLALRHFMMIREHYGTSKQKWKDIRRAYLLFCVGVLALFLMLFIWRRITLINDFELEHRSTGIILQVLIVAIICFVAGSFIVFYRSTEPLPDGKLADSVRELVRKSGIRHCSIRIKRIKETDMINGGCMKLPGRTLIFLHYCPEKEEDNDLVLAAAAHELGHGVQISWQWELFFTVLAFLPFILVFIPVFPIGLYQWFGKAYLLFLYLMYFPALIFMGLLYRRRMETDADAYAVKAGLAAPAERLFRKYLSDGDYEPPNPCPALVAMTYTYPPLSQRIEAIEKITDRTVQATGSKVKGE